MKKKNIFGKSFFSSYFITLYDATKVLRPFFVPKSKKKINKVGK